jgi:hypothetical protein
VAHNSLYDVALLKIIADKSKVFPSIKISDSGPMLGKTVIVPMFFDGQDKIEVGRVSGVKPGVGTSTMAELETTIAVPESWLGSPIIDTKGMLVGMQIGAKRSLHSGAIKSILDTVTNVQ